MAGEAADGGPRRSGRLWAESRWLYALVLLVALVPLVLVIIHGYVTLQDQLTYRAGTNLHSVSELSARLLEERFQRIRDLTVSLATRVRFRQLVGEGKWSEAIPIMDEVSESFPFVDRILLTDRAGVLRADIPEAPEVHGVDFSHRDWYQGAIRDGTYVSEVYRRKATPSSNVLACACLIRNERKETAGILVIQVTLRTLLAWCQEVDVGRSGFIYVVDHHAHLAAHPRVDPEQEIIDLASLRHARKALQDGSSAGIEEDPVLGGEYLTCSTTLKPTGWRIVATQPTAEAFAERESESGRLLVKYGLLSVLTGFLAWLLLRALAARDRALARMRERVEDRLDVLEAEGVSSDPGALRIARAMAWAAAGLCAATGTVVLVGWVLDAPLLKGLSPGWVTMKANTALGLLLAGGALSSVLARTRDGGSGMATALGRLAPAGVLAIGVLSFLEHAAGLDLRIDQALFREAPGAVGTSAPGRMAPATALCFSMAGAALLLGGTRGPAAAVALPALGGAVLLLGGITVVGYLYGVDALLGPARFTVMALHTGIAFVVLGLGVLCAHPDLAPVRLLLSDSLGGLQARRLLVPLVGVPMLLGWLRLEGQRAGYYDTEFGVALFLVSSVILLVAFLLWTGAGLARVDEERRRANEARLRGLEALEVANKELEAFSYSVSHDLRAPLRTISGFSQAIEEDCGAALGEVGRDHLRRVRTEAGRMGLLIDDLLRLSRLMRAEMRREEVDLAVLAREVVEDLRRGSPGRDVEVLIPPTLPARGDAALLRIVLQNLVDNAWKFTSRREKARIEVGGEQRGGESVYYVRDNGDGFDPAYTHKLFGAFQRLHSTSEFPGVGIGLVTVQRIVQRHGGRVWAEGAPGKGATFSFVLEGKA